MTATVWILRGPGFTVYARAQAAPRATVRPGANQVTHDELATLRLYPEWTDREARGEIVAGGPGEVQMMELIGRTTETSALAFILKHEHRRTPKRRAIIAAAYCAMADRYDGCGLATKADRAWRKARRYRALVEPTVGTRASR